MPSPSGELTSRDAQIENRWPLFPAFHVLWAVIPIAPHSLIWDSGQSLERAWEEEVEQRLFFPSGELPFLLEPCLQRGVNPGKLCSCCSDPHGCEVPCVRSSQAPGSGSRSEKDGAAASPEFRVLRANVRSSASLPICCRFSVRIGGGNLASSWNPQNEMPEDKCPPLPPSPPPTFAVSLRWG